MNSGVQHKLLTYEIHPHPGVWSIISAELDDSEIDRVFPDTLYAAEVIPPVTIWNKIQVNLAADKEKTKPIFNRYSAILRYAAAAILIGIFAWGAVRLLNKKSGEKEIAVNKSAEPVPKKNNISILDTTPEQITSNAPFSASVSNTEESRNDAALEASKRTFARLDLSTGNKRLKNIAVAYSFAFSKEKESYSKAFSSPGEYLTDHADRYIKVLNAEGNNIRISKKLGYLLCCVSGDEETTDCKNQMSRWREKIACSTIGHSTGSILDVFSLISLLQDQ